MTILKNDGAALKGIEELRRRDIAASKAYDAEALASLWTEDAVTLAPGQPPTYGREAIRAKLAGVKAAAAQMEVLEYVEVFEETLIFGDHAIEWGCIRGAERINCIANSRTEARLRFVHSKSRGSNLRTNCLRTGF